MKKNLLLYILLAFLIVMNGFFLFKHFGSTETESVQKRGPGNFIAKQLEFDEAQTIQFKKLDELHHEKIRALLDDLKESKDVLFDQLTNETVNNVAIDSLANVIAKKQALKEIETFNFFRSVSDLCNEDQKVRFKEIIKDAVRGMPGGPDGNGPPGGPNGKGPRGGPDGDRRPPPPRH